MKNKTKHPTQKHIISLEEVLESKRKKHKQLKKSIETHKRLTQNQTTKTPLKR